MCLKMGIKWQKEFWNSHSFLSLNFPHSHDQKSENFKINSLPSFSIYLVCKSVVHQVILFTTTINNCKQSKPPPMQNGIAADYMMCMEFPHWIFLNTFAFFLTSLHNCFWRQRGKNAPCYGAFVYNEKACKDSNNIWRTSCLVFEAYYTMS